MQNVRIIRYQYTHYIVYVVADLAMIYHVKINDFNIILHTLFFRGCQ